MKRPQIRVHSWHRGFMRVLVAIVLSLTLTTGCSYLTVEKPGPRCEETGADVADTATAVISGLIALPLGIAATDCIDGCGDDGPEVAVSLLALTASAVLFGASARHGSRYNDECRRARGWQ